MILVLRKPMLLFLAELLSILTIQLRPYADCQGFINMLHLAIIV